MRREAGGLPGGQSDSMVIIGPEDAAECSPKARFPANVTMVPKCAVETPDAMSTGESPLCQNVFLLNSLGLWQPKHFFNHQKFSCQKPQNLQL